MGGVRAASRHVARDDRDGRQGQSYRPYRTSADLQSRSIISRTYSHKARSGSIESTKDIAADALREEAQELIESLRGWAACQQDVPSSKRVMVGRLPECSLADSDWRLHPPLHRRHFSFDRSSWRGSLGCAGAKCCRLDPRALLGNLTGANQLDMASSHSRRLRLDRVGQRVGATIDDDFPGRLLSGFRSCSEFSILPMHPCFS